MKYITHKPKAPVYHRQRLLLYFLEAAEPGLRKLDLQKLLFLYNQEIKRPYYDFVPYKYGCYSFLCADDLDLLEKRGWVDDNGNQLFLSIENLDTEPWAKNNRERWTVKKWMGKNRKRGDALVTETYRRHPYYALNSQMKERLLNRVELQTVRDSIASVEDNSEIVFTLGYEGLHFETYLNKLIRNCVKALCDVRRNPNSRKFGFSGRMLGQLLPKFGIKYLHIPQLGIELEKRRELKSEQDYDRLFTSYRKTFPSEKEGLKRLRKAIQTNRRVALTCFEAEPRRCHRHCIAELLESEDGYRIVHL